MPEPEIPDVRELTGGIGVDRVIDAVGVDAQRLSRGLAAEALRDLAGQFDHERAEAAAPEVHPDGDTWVAGDAPSLAARWAVQMSAKAGSVGTVGI